MWALPREDMILKNVCPCLIQAEETVMGSNPCLAFPSNTSLVSLFYQEKETNGITGTCKNSKGGKSYDSNTDFCRKNSAKNPLPENVDKGHKILQ